ncbi:MAG TPA: mechanosensitive ion channel family protein [Syntrophales bacterium]|jgi:MscS family membrane protein|nr:mechanosensitive ion channel family protein [Syntrophales bacterium]HQA83333.1 mechanosensitive ion channel family protein [Syntrophales bacterium]
MEWEAYIGKLIDGDHEYKWIVVFLIVFFALLVDFIQKKILSHLHQRTLQTENPWDNAIVASLKKPLSALIWILGVYTAIHFMVPETSFLELSQTAGYVAVIVVMTWFLLNLVRQAHDNILEIHRKKGDPIDATTADAIGKLLRISILITASLMILQTLGFSISGVLAFGGIGGIAVGFAAKDILSNFFGGLTIFLDRPFAVGDWIRSPDRNIEGVVEYIGWRLTRIRTFENRPLYVPNATFTTIALENPSRMTHRRIYETIGVRHDDAGKIMEIVQDVRTMLIEHPGIDPDQTLIVNFNTFGPSSLDFFIYAYTRTKVWVEYHQVKEDVLMKAYRIVVSHGAEVAFPTSTIHIPERVLLGQAEVLSKK